MENSNSLGGARIALLIDFDNVILGIDDPGFDIELVVNALRERGTIVVSRVYGDWYRHSRHRRHLMEHGCELIEAPAFGPVIKNSADIKIALDGYEIGMTMPHINTFCLVSGDSDFLPLVKKLQSLGKNVLVICGNRFTSDMLRRNCNEFISYENLLAASYGASEDATTIDGAFTLLLRAMAALRERGSEIRTSTLKQMMIQLNPVFSEKTFGFNQFRGFLDKAGRENLIKLGPRDRVSGEFYVLLPEEDEADVIENNERAEPAQIAEEIVESRRSGGRGRRGDNSERNAERSERNGSGRDNRRDNAPAETETAVESPRVSRREARLQALREQEELESQAPAVQGAADVAAPLASPLTPATDFSPATAEEAREKSISRNELLARGLRVGRVKFSGKTGRVEAVAPVEAGDAPIGQPDIALTMEDVNAEDAPIATLDSGAESASEKPKRSRSRRRKKANDAPTEITESETSQADEQAATATESGEIEAETPSSEAVTSIDAVEQIAESQSSESAPMDETTESEAPSEKKPRRRRTSRRKAEATPEIDEAPVTTDAPAPQENADESPVEVTVETPIETETEATATEAEEKPKTKRTRRRKKTEGTIDEMEKAIPSDGTQQTVSKEALIEASVGKPATKTRARRTSRKVAETTADVKSSVNENIVTTDETTGEVSQQELAQIPVPVSEDEL